MIVNPTIRIASPHDNILLAEFGRRTFFDTFAKDNTPEDMAAYLASAFSPQIQSAELADERNTFLLAEVEGVIAGYAKLRLGTPPPAVTGNSPMEIARFYVDQPWFGSGVAAALMNACLDFARAKGCDVVWLGVWEHNPRAIAFYRKWGFWEVGKQIFKLGSDLQTDLIMQRRGL